MNKGDIAVFGELDRPLTPADLINGDQMYLTVWPGEIWLKDDPEADFQYYFYEERPNDAGSQWELFRLNNIGFKRVNKENGFEWCDRFGNEGHAKLVTYSLLALPADKYHARRDAEGKQAKDQVTTEMESAYVDAEKLGVGIKTITNGEEKILSKPAKKLYKS